MIFVWLNKLLCKINLHQFIEYERGRWVCIVCEKSREDTW